jgi:hypothetical protein
MHRVTQSVTKCITARSVGARIIGVSARFFGLCLTNCMPVRSIGVTVTFKLF